MNAIEKLLKIDAGSIKKPTKEFEIKRLSELAGEQIIIKVQSVDDTEQDAIREMAYKSDDKLDVSEFRKGMILAGVVEPNLRDESIRKHFKAATPYDLIDKLFLPGEKDAIYEKISQLSGYNKDAVEEVKN